MGLVNALCAHFGVERDELLEAAGAAKAPKKAGRRAAKATEEGEGEGED